MMEPACLLWSSAKRLSVGASVGQASELMHSYNNVAQLGHFRDANIGRESGTGKTTGIVNQT
jgi:hypothetical protein